MSAQKPNMPYNNPSGPKNFMQNQNYRRNESKPYQSYNSNYYPQNAQMGQDGGRRPQQSQMMAHGADGLVRGPWHGQMSYQFLPEEVRRNSHMGMPIGITQGVDYNNLAPKQHFSQDLQYMPAIVTPVIANSVAQPWIMHPNEAMLPQIGNMPMSSFSSSRGSPDGSDYGSSVASNAELVLAAGEMHGNRAVAHNVVPDVPDGSLGHTIAGIRHQIEYYFSSQNLARDAYLLGQMDAEQYVSVALIAGFKMVQKWTQDINLIKEAMRSSPKLELDATGTKVRAVNQMQAEYKPPVQEKQRTTVVVHHLPDSIKKEDIEMMFSASSVKPVNLECADKTCWYVDFEDELDAHEALRYLREEVREFCGKAISTRIRAIPATVMNMYKGVDNVSPGPGVPGPTHVPASADESMQMLRNPSDVLSAQQYPMFAPIGGPGASFYPMAMSQGQMNQPVILFPAPAGGYSHAYVDPTYLMALNQMNFMPQNAAVPPAPPMYRNTGQHMHRGRGGGRRGGGMSGYDNRNNSRYQRGGSIPNSGRNSAMSESRLDYNHGYQLSPDHSHSRHGSFSSMNGNYGRSSPVIVRSGSNTPPMQQEETPSLTFGHEERRNTFPNSRKPKRASIESQVPSVNDSYAPSTSQAISIKENLSKFDLEPTMFPPLPGQSTSETVTGGSNSGQSAAVHPVNISAADVVRGVISPKIGQQTGKVFMESESATDFVERGRNSSMVGHNFWGQQADKKEQGSSTDDLPKSGREQYGTDGRPDGNTDRYRVNSSAGTQTATTVAPVHGENAAFASTEIVPPASASQTSSLSHMKSPLKKQEPHNVGAEEARSPDKQDTVPRQNRSPGKANQTPSPQKSEDGGSVGSVTEGMKGVSMADNGKSGGISYARVAQMNRDKLFAPTSASASSSSAASTRGPPLTKQSSLDSSGHSQEDRRSVKQEWNHSESGGSAQKSSPRGHEIHERAEGSVNGIHDNQYMADVGYLNGSADGDMGKDDGQGENDTEGFTEVIKHHKAHIRHDRHHRATGSVRYPGASN